MKLFHIKENNKYITNATFVIRSILYVSGVYLKEDKYYYDIYIQTGCCFEIKFDNKEQAIVDRAFLIEGMKVL